MTRVGGCSRNIGEIQIVIRGLWLMGLRFRSGVEYLTVAECVDVSTNNTIVENSDLVGQWTSSLGHCTWYPRNRNGGEVFRVDQISDLEGSEGFEESCCCACLVW